MKLAETNFDVVYNQNFLEILNADLRQLAWVVQQAAEWFDVSVWGKNTDHTDLDCWQQEIIHKDQKLTVEAVPYGTRTLVIWLRFNEATLPRGEGVRTLKYPQDFEKYKGKSNKDLGIIRADK